MRLLYVLISFGLLISSTCALAQRNNINGLSINDNKYFQNGSPYSGVAYNCYQSGQLKEEFSLMNGMFNGIYATYKIDDRYDKSKYIDTILIAKKIILIEEVKLDILKLKKDSIRSLDSIWMQEEELLGGKVFKQLESIEVLKRKEKLKSIEDKYTYDKLNKKKVDLYDKYADARKKFQDCTESLATYRFRLKAHNEWLVNEKNKPIYKNILGETFNYERGVQTGTHVVYTKSGDREIEETLDNGKKNGPYKRYSGNKIVEEGNYVNNEKEGSWILYHENGNKEQEYSYVQGEIEGKVITYYENGNKEQEYSKVQGKFEGKFNTYYENGNKKQESSYVQGKFEGRFITYHENGNKKQESSRVHGEKEGQFIAYHENGKKSQESSFTNDKENGSSISYHENGNRYIIGNWVNGTLNGNYKVFHENGNLKEESIMINGTNKYNGSIRTLFDLSGNYEKKIKFDESVGWTEYFTPEEADKRLKELYDKNNEIVSCNWCGREFKYGKGYDYAHYKYTNHTCDCSLIGIGGYFCSPKCSIEWCEK